MRTLILTFMAVSASLFVSAQNTPRSTNLGISGPTITSIGGPEHTSLDITVTLKPAVR